MELLNEFAHWWWAGLLGALPNSLREWLVGRNERIDVVLSEVAMEFTLYMGGNNEAVATRTFSRAASDSRVQIHDWLAAHGVTQRCVELHLPADRLLKKHLSFPKAAARSLRPILEIELERQTPFVLAEICFDHRVVEEDLAAERIKVEFCLARRQDVEALRSEFYALDLAVGAIRDAQAPVRFNLLPPDLLPPRRSRWQRTTQIAGVFAFLALVMALYVPPFYLDLRRSTEEAKAAELRKLAVAARTLEAERDALRARANFLDERRKLGAPMSNVLKALTETLPDDTYLDQFTLQGRRVEVAGASGSASALIELLEQTPQFDTVRFRAPVTQSPDAKYSRFLIEMQVTQGNGL